nr:Rieske (2Fe-2S) domain-containing protein [uncultured bacterium]
MNVRATQAPALHRGPSVDFASAGPGTPGGMFLRKFWQPVHLSSTLKAGTAKPITIMGEKFTLYRGETGIAHVVGYRCAHRSTQLSTGWVRGDCIQCIYHGWTFDGDGQCVARPAEEPSGPAKGVAVPAYPTREHLGLIYAYFGEGEPPAFPPFPDYDVPGVIENYAIDFPCNWFQTYENQIDEVHIAFVHSFGGSHRALGRELELPELNAYETPYGMIRETRSGGGSWRHTLYLFPNTMRIIIPTFKDMSHVGGWRDTYITLVPTNDESHILFMTKHAKVKPEEMEEWQRSLAAFNKRIGDNPPPRQMARDILDGKLAMSDVLDHPLLLVIEDAVAQQGQGEIADRSIERLGRSDIGIARMRRLFERELKAISEGRPTKDWVYSGEPAVQGF